jgi:hypothetical protein
MNGIATSTATSREFHHEDDAFDFAEIDFGRSLRERRPRPAFPRATVDVVVVELDGTVVDTFGRGCAAVRGWRTRLTT